MTRFLHVLMFAILLSYTAWADIFKEAAMCVTVAENTQHGPFRICASSYLAPQGKNLYGPDMAMDYNEKTAWVEGVQGSGEGQWLALGFDGERHFQSLFIVNGYIKSKKAFRDNGRVQILRVQAADGLDIRIELKDHMKEQEIRFPRKVVSPWLRLGIVSTYPGGRWSDAAITDFWIDLDEYNYQGIDGE
ncbi:MAG: hypothetical protein HQM14_20790 [SAR324 cluster bacterium]|nr:hypothetical protein [SAR324 cluster bacterium]